jgi:hypothetical protein
MEREMARELMTAAEIHDFGIEVVSRHLSKEGHQIESVNLKVGINPQIVARKNSQLEFIVVRTACYPHKGQIENDALAPQCLAQADKFKATCYFASVGIANATARMTLRWQSPSRVPGSTWLLRGW